MSVFDSDLPGKTRDDLEGLERYYLHVQRQRAMTDNERERLNAILAEVTRRHNEGV